MQGNAVVNAGSMEEEKGKYDFEGVCREVEKKYLEIVRLQIVMAYRDMITLRGMVEEAMEPYKEVCAVREGEELQYIFRKHREFMLELEASMTGTFKVIQGDT